MRVDPKKLLASNTAFTIQEVIVAIVIVGVLAGLSYPSFVNNIKKITNQEAETILIALYEAQKDYAFETGSYTTTASDLDVTFSTPKGFNAPLALDGNFSCHGGNSVEVIGSINRNNPDGYTLYVEEDTGIIYCCPITNGNSICTELGLNPWP